MSRRQFIRLLCYCEGFHEGRIAESVWINGDGAILANEDYVKFTPSSFFVLYSINTTLAGRGGWRHVYMSLKRKVVFDPEDHTIVHEFRCPSRSEVDRITSIFRSVQITTPQLAILLCL